MSAAAELRKQVESALAGRIPSALSFRTPTAPELVSCGIPELDSVLGGGLPLGGITELAGVHSSGRTTLTLSTLAEITRQGESCAYVDVSDALDPVSAAALGVNLRRLLWVRTNEPSPRSQKKHPGQTSGCEVQAPFFGSVLEQKEAMPSGRCGGFGHPRSETIGLHRAVGNLFQSATGEPDYTPRCAESKRRSPLRPVAFIPVSLFAGGPHPPSFGECGKRTPRQQSWTRLDHALRATDLLLSTGGFRAIVLDLGDVSPEQARRVPLATWYRFRLQVEKSRTLFLLMTRVPCANSCAAVSLHCSQDDIDFERADVASPQLLTGLRYRLSIERNRAIDPTRKKSAASVEALWTSRTPWSR